MAMSRSKKSDIFTWVFIGVLIVSTFFGGIYLLWAAVLYHGPVGGIYGDDIYFRSLFTIAWVWLFVRTGRLWYQEIRDTPKWKKHFRELIMNKYGCTYEELIARDECNKHMAQIELNKKKKETDDHE